jgi:poly(3-hydroxyalkanoate) depolymerase
MRIARARLGRHDIRYGIRAGDTSRTPLLLLNGLGANIELAQPFIDALPGPDIVIFDVPGVGGSPTPFLPYRPATIANIAADLLDHLGHEVADVLGISWGGAIAQDFAMRHPARCRRLVLVATAPGALMVPGNPRVLLKMATPRRYLDPAYAHRVAGEIYGGDFRSDPALVARTLRHIRFSSRRGYYFQLAAVVGWTSLPWLWTLRPPTLVMAGRDDPIVPAINARIMQRLIPDARLEVVDSGHLFLVTRPEASARIVDDFLTSPSPHSRRTALRTSNPPFGKIS